MTEFTNGPDDSQYPQLPPEHGQEPTYDDTYAFGDAGKEYYDDSGIVPPDDEPTIDLTEQGLPGGEASDTPQEAAEVSEPFYLSNLRRSENGLYELAVSPLDRRNAEAVIAGAQEGMYVFNEGREATFTNRPPAPGAGVGEGTRRWYAGIELPVTPVEGMNETERADWHNQVTRSLRDSVLVLRTRSDSEPPAHENVVQPRIITPVPEEYRKMPVDIKGDAATMVIAGLASIIAKGEGTDKSQDIVDAREAARAWNEMAGALQYNQTRARQQSNEQ